jgi:hypothetical protein
MRKLILLWVLALVSCTSTRPVIDPNKIYLNRQDAILEPLEDVRFVVLTDGNKTTIFENLETDGQGKILISLTEEEYKKLSRNFQRLLNYIREQKNILDLYRKHYEK